MKLIKLSTDLLFVVLSAGFLTACGGSGDSSSTEAAVPTPGASAAAATPAAPSSNFAGTYTGTAGRVNNASTYEGPLSLVLTRDVTGNYTVSGSWNVTRTNSSGPQSTTNNTLSGTVSSSGALTVSGNINLRSITGNVDLATSKITGIYTYAGVAGDFMGDFLVTK